MSGWLSKPVDLAKSAWNVVQSVGPFLISQSDKASETFARHQARLAGVDVVKELMLQEVHTLGEVKKQLLERYITAEADERVRIRRDLDEIGASVRQLKIGTQALNYLPAPSVEQPSSPAPEPQPRSQPELSPHWTDKFNDLARAHNEPWREDLLARALATESASVGTVSPRALWLLGTLEETAFNAFATLLDLTSFVGGGLMIPSHQLFNERPIPGYSLGQSVSIGNPLYQIDEVGLFANPLTTSLTVRKGSGFIAAYGTSRFFIRCAEADMSISGIVPTSLGASLASFYQPKQNPLGKEIFDAWLASLNKAHFPTQQIA